MTTHRAAVLASALAVPLTLLPAIPSHAEPLTCEGRAVTVAGDVGTAGDDVMVVGSTATGVASSGAGNDLVCIRVTSSREPLTFGIDAGPGDDRLVNESTDDNTRVTVVLGSGADTYLGSNVTGELVVGGATGWSRAGDTSDVETDVIDTGGGNDVVYSGSVNPGVRNPDRITLGDGDDGLHWAGDQSGPAVDFGAGRGFMALYPGWYGTDLSVDAGARTATVDGRRVLAWTGDVTSYSLRIDSLRTTFTGTDADESLLYAVAHPGTPGAAILPDPARRLDADMAAGDDSITEWEFVGGSLVGGPGDDSLRAGRCLEADVRLGETFTCLAAYSPRVVYTPTLDAWEEIQVPGGLVSVVGTPGPDRVIAAGSRVRVLGGGGDDWLAASGSRSQERRPWMVILDGGPGDDTVSGGYGHDKLIGGSGKDRLAGSSGDDLLLGGGGADRLWAGIGRDEVRGGQGRDRANGEAGRDRCVAEVRRSCER